MGITLSFGRLECARHGLSLRYRDRVISVRLLELVKLASETHPDKVFWHVWKTSLDVSHHAVDLTALAQFIFRLS